MLCWSPFIITQQIVIWLEYVPELTRRIASGKIDWTETEWIPTMGKADVESDESTVATAASTATDSKRWKLNRFEQYCSVFVAKIIKKIQKRIHFLRDSVLLIAFHFCFRCRCHRLRIRVVPQSNWWASLWRWESFVSVWTLVVMLRRSSGWL